MSIQRTPRDKRRARGVIAVLGGLLALPWSGIEAQPATEPAVPLGVPAHGMFEDPFNRAIRVDELEKLDAAESTQRWDLSFWAGRSLERLTVRTEGERSAGTTQRAELQLLWTRSFMRWWDIVAGARADFSPGPDRTWAAIGVQGLAPYRVALEATAFVAGGGDAAARVTAEHELRITPRLILEPQLELNWHGQSHVPRGYGAGLSSGEAALRLRYEIRREIAPYVGIVRQRRWGDSADAARAAGLDNDDTSLVAGVRLRF